MKEEESESEKESEKDWIDIAAVVVCDLHLCVEHLVDGGKINFINNQNLS